MLLLTGAGKKWRERACLTVVRLMCQVAVAKHSNKPVIRHALKECCHDAQCFALPNFGGNRHIEKVAANINFQRARLNDSLPRAALEVEDAGKGFFDDNVRRPLECRTFYPRAA
jgi:hypothetical protein